MEVTLDVPGLVYLSLASFRTNNRPTNHTSKMNYRAVSQLQIEENSSMVPKPLSPLEDFCLYNIYSRQYRLMFTKVDSVD